MTDIDYLRAYAVLDGERLDSLWAEIDRLRAENASLRLEVSGLESSPMSEEALDILRSENADLRARVAEPEEQYSIRWPQLRELDAARKEVLYTLAAITRARCSAEGGKVKRHSQFEKIAKDFEDIANGSSVAQKMAWGVIIVALFFSVKYLILEVFG